MLRGRQVDSKFLAAGSWVEVGKPTAMEWIANGIAVARGIEKVELDPDCGVVALGDTQEAKARLSRYGLTCPITGRTDAIPYGRTLYWRPEVKLRVDLIPAGFGMLAKWELAVPLWSHERLASEIGTPAERERTQALIRDLRVPIYEPAVIFVRQCDGARALLERFAEEKRGTDERLAFLRALYITKPLVLALPATWIE